MSAVKLAEEFSSRISFLETLVQEDTNILVTKIVDVIIELKKSQFSSVQNLVTTDSEGIDDGTLILNVTI